MKKMSKEMKLVDSRKSKRRLVNCIRVSNSEQEKEMIAGARSDRIFVFHSAKWKANEKLLLQRSEII